MPSKRKVTPRAILLRAARILEHDGWCRNEFSNSRGHHCAMGAIRVAAYRLLPKISFNLRVRSIQKCVFALAEEVQPGWTDPQDAIINWNDGDTRRGFQVIAKLRKVANAV